jgi:hypothetical protein
LENLPKNYLDYLLFRLNHKDIEQALSDVSTKSGQDHNKAARFLRKEYCLTKNALL